MKDHSTSLPCTGSAAADGVTQPAAAAGLPCASTQAAAASEQSGQCQVEGNGGSAAAASYSDSFYDRLDTLVVGFIEKAPEADICSGCGGPTVAFNSCGC